MKKSYLVEEPPDDFILFGIVTQELPHRLAWFINKIMEFGFVRNDDIVFLHNGKEESHFSRFDYSDELNRLDYHLLSNNEEGIRLIPELRNVDFLLMIKGALSYFDKDHLLTLLKTIETIRLITEISPARLKSRQHLVLPGY